MSKFIAFEGIDGSGKSTQSKLFVDKLLNTTLPAILTCQPTSEPIGKMIRTIFSGKMDADQRTIAALFAADRLEHILNRKNGILKLLSDGNIVVSDRYLLSSYAYQGVHVDLDWVIQINRESSALLFPDLTFFIDIDPQNCMERIIQHRTHIEPYETLDNLNKVKDMYYKSIALLSETQQKSIIIINGNQSIDNIAAEVWSHWQQVQ